MPPGPAALLAARTAGYAARRQPETILLYAALAVLLGGSYFLGHAGIGLVRPLFMGGCVGVAFMAWRISPGQHLEASIVLFAFAPFLRRVTDLSLGFDPSGTMLSGALLSLMVPCTDLYAWFVTGRERADGRMLVPFGIMAVCLLYGWALSSAAGGFMASTIEAVKVFTPMLYGLWLMVRAGEHPDLVERAARGLLIAMPVAAAYGLYQYFYLPDWDRYWMVSSGVTAMGQPLPRQVRVFATLNSPASFATFAATALLLLGFVRGGWLSLLMCVPIATGLLLSLYRTAWLGLVAGVLYCWLHQRTRRRAELITIWVAVAGFAVLSTTSFGDMVLERLATLTGSVAQDGSGRERLAEFTELYDHIDALQFGGGLSLTNMNRIGGGQVVVDGTIVASILQMGLYGGILYVCGVIWAAVQALVQVERAPSAPRVVAGAIVVASLVELPLASIAGGEFGFLFWSFVGLAAARVTRPGDPPRRRVT